MLVAPSAQTGMLAVSSTLGPGLPTAAWRGRFLLLTEEMEATQLKSLEKHDESETAL